MAMRAIFSDEKHHDVWEDAYEAYWAEGYHVTDMCGFMDTFDLAVTVSDEGWEKWVQRNKILPLKVTDEKAMMISYLGLSPYMKDPFNRVALIEGAYDVSCHVHGSEKKYLEFLLLSEDEGL